VVAVGVDVFLNQISDVHPLVFVPRSYYFENDLKTHVEKVINLKAI
jgi:hypothetical protein